MRKPRPAKVAIMKLVYKAFGREYIIIKSNH